MPSAKLRSALAVVAGAASTWIAADLLAARLSPPPPPLLEVEDGIAAVTASDPDVLALGSSHTRSFVPFKDALAKQPDPQQMVLVPVEAGSFGCYEWVVEHRLRPLLEERRNGELVRKKLSRFVFVTTYYDLCHKAARSNLPGRAWVAENFLEDVEVNGITDFNRNYLQRRFNRALVSSRLATDLGVGRIIEDQKERLRSPARTAAYKEAQLARWRRLVEDQYGYCDDPVEKAALDDVLRYLTGRGIEVIFAVFPLMPSTLTEKAKETTVKRYADYLAALSRRFPIRVVDMTYDSPLADGDFMADLDHVTLPGNQKFSAWALANDLAWMKTPHRDGIPDGEVAPP